MKRMMSNNNTMSHPNPTYDPMDEPSAETLAERAEAAYDAQREDEAIRAQELWETAVYLDRASMKDLNDLLKQLKPETRLRVYLAIEDYQPDKE